MQIRFVITHQSSFHSLSARNLKNVLLSVLLLTLVLGSIVSIPGCGGKSEYSNTPAASQGDMIRPKEQKAIQPETTNASENKSANKVSPNVPPRPLHLAEATTIWLTFKRVEEVPGLGERFEAVIAVPVESEGKTAIPLGADAIGTITPIPLGDPNPTSIEYRLEAVTVDGVNVQVQSTTGLRFTAKIGQGKEFTPVGQKQIPTVSSSTPVAFTAAKQ